MSIIDHLSLGVPDIEKACAFYDPLLATLGYQRLVKTEGLAAYGEDAIQFLVMLPSDGDEYGVGNGAHVCFAAHGREAVNAFHATALEKGGKDAGSPGPRPAYPNPQAYTAYVRDPFGNKLEAIHNGFAA